MSLSGTKIAAIELEKVDADTVMGKVKYETVDCGEISFSEEEKKKRSIYYHIGDSDTLRLLGRDDLKYSIEVKNCPYGKSDITRYGVGSWKSKIYFVGGCYSKNLDRKSNKIFTFDTSLNSWLETVVTLPEPLASFPVVCCHKGHLFVFGTVWDNDLMMPKSSHFAAAYAYNINGGYWLSTTDDLCPSPPTHKRLFTNLNLFTRTQACFVYDEIIYFLIYGTADYCMYHFATKQWSESRSLPQQLSDLRWSFAVAVIQGYIFYHFDCEIYCYDLNNHVHYNLLQLPGCTRCGIYVNSLGYPTHTFLVHAGNGLLCLLLPPLGDHRRPVLRYWLQIHSSSPGSECPFGVSVVGSPNLLPMGYGIWQVLEV